MNNILVPTDFSKNCEKAVARLQKICNYSKSFCDSPTLPRPGMKVDADFGSPLIKLFKTLRVTENGLVTENR